MSAEPIHAVVFDRPAWEEWVARLAEREPERAQSIREGMALADWFDVEWAKIFKEKMHDHPERNDA